MSLSTSSHIFPQNAEPKSLPPLPRRDRKQHRGLPVRKSAIDAEKALALELHHLAHLQRGHVPVRHGLGAELRPRRQEVLVVLPFLDLVLGEEEVEVDGLDGDELLARGGEPGDFLGGRLHVAGEVEVEGEGGDGAEGERVEGVGDVADDGVAPVHEGDFLVGGEGARVGLLEEDRGGVGDFLGAQVRVLVVFGLVFGVGRGAGAFDGRGDGVGCGDGRVAGRDGVDVFLVRGPEERPVEVDDVAGGALLEDVLPQGADGHASAADAADGGEAGVVPAPDEAGFDELGEFALREQRADEVHAGEIPDVDFAELEDVLEPFVLGITVAVLVGPESVGDTFEGVEDGHAEVVGGVDFPGGAGAVVGLGVAAVDDRVTHGFVGVIDGHFGADAPLGAFGGARFHFGEVGEVGFDAGITAGAREALHALVAHFFLLGVVGVGFADFDDVGAVVVHFLEVVAGVAGSVGADAHKS
jgi:hypothetical protein